MIESLSIRNYALIDRIDLKFKAGFNVITGETGAGKSIMLGALSMLLGSRADSRVVTHRESKSIVEATFRLSGRENLRGIFIESDIDWDDSSVILRREISPAGRSRSFVNDSPVPLSILREIALQLVDLHSQHQNLLLSTPEYQLSIIDSLLPDKSVTDLYVAAYNDYKDALRQYAKARKVVEAARNEEEYLRYQLEKLNDADLVEGEQEQLEKEREILSNVSQLKHSLNSLLGIFSESDTSVTVLLTSALPISESLAALPDGQSLRDRIESLSIEAKDISASIEELFSGLDIDPSRLEYIDDHLSDIYNLQRKHNVSSVEELIALRDSIASRLASIDNADDRLHTLASRARKAKATATSLAADLSARRKEVASSFGTMLKESAVPLGMKNLSVDIQVSPSELSSTGADKVDFLFAFNKNQPLMPVRDTASGGEISRLMLSVKAIMADKMNLPSIIFDEVDTGVSGDVANRMGQLMQQISQNIQVIAITHLPQVASKGVAHFKVFKEDSDTATNTRVTELDDVGRIDELALMLSGDTENEAARQTAVSLLNDSNPSKERQS